MFTGWVLQHDKVILYKCVYVFGGGGVGVVPYEHEEAAHDPGEGAGVILQHRQHQTPTVGALRADWPLLEGVGGPTPGLRDDCFSVCNN